LGRNDWPRIFGILVAQGLISIPFNVVENELIEAQIIPFPIAAQLSLASNEILLEGGWIPILIVLTLLAINVFAEELWFRGYVFPRQEIVHGRTTWVTHWMSWWLSSISLSGGG
jgi:membrane protease YdiL (CAAX protease family)